MIYCFDSYDCAGKTTLAKAMSVKYNIPIYLDGKSQRPEFKSLKDHKLWARSAYNYLARLIASNVEMDMIIDRWIFTEYCYAPVLRGYSIDDYYYEIEKTVAPSGKFVWVFPFVNSTNVLKDRYEKKKEEYVSFKNLLKIKDSYDTLFSGTKYRAIKISTDALSVKECVTAVYNSFRR